MLVFNGFLLNFLKYARIYDALHINYIQFFQPVFNYLCIYLAIISTRMEKKS